MEDRNALRFRLAEPHIAPLQAITEEIIVTHPDAEAPIFDPEGPGTRARLMMVYQRPNAIASTTGFICIENSDPTARQATEFFQQSGIAKQNCLLWNVVFFSLATITLLGKNAPNLGHARVLTTLTSYAAVPYQRQAKLIRDLANS